MLARFGFREQNDHPDHLICLLIAIIIAIIQVIFLLWRYSSWFYDDPFITYRYAWNLVHGVGFVFNPGDKVLSTTTPLFTLLLAGLGVIWSDIPKIATVIGCISTGLSGLIFWDLAQQWKLNIASWVGLLLIPTFPLLDITISSETPLYIALILGTLDGYARRHYRLVAILASLLVLTRPDGVILPILIAIHFIIRRNRPIPWTAIGIFILVNILWFGFAWLYFGSPLPVTLMTKQQQGVMTISQLFAPGFLRISAPYTQNWYYITEAVLAIMGVIWLVIRRHISLLLLLWTLLYFLAYSLLGVTRYFWYYAPLVPGFILIVGAGMQSVYELIKHALRSRFTNMRLERVLYVILAIFWICQGSNTYTYSQVPDWRYEIYRNIGGWLAANTNPIDRIGMVETGIIGYYSERPIVDFAGLIQPEVAKQMRPDSTYQDTARWAILTYHPSYLVLNPDGFPSLMKDYVSNKCQLVLYFNKEMYGSNQDMAIYHCTGST